MHDGGVCAVDKPYAGVVAVEIVTLESAFRFVGIDIGGSDVFVVSVLHSVFAVTCIMNQLGCVVKRDRNGVGRFGNHECHTDAVQYVVAAECFRLCRYVAVGVNRYVSRGFRYADGVRRGLACVDEFGGFHLVRTADHSIRTDSEVDHVVRIVALQPECTEKTGQIHIVKVVDSHVNRVGGDRQRIRHLHIVEQAVVAYHRGVDMIYAVTKGNGRFRLVKIVHPYIVFLVGIRETGEKSRCRIKIIHRIFPRYGTIVIGNHQRNRFLSVLTLELEPVVRFGVQAYLLLRKHQVYRVFGVYHVVMHMDVVDHTFLRTTDNLDVGEISSLRDGCHQRIKSDFYLFAGSVVSDIGILHIKVRCGERTGKRLGDIVQYHCIIFIIT